MRTTDMPKKHQPLWSSERRECWLERGQNGYELYLRRDGSLVRVEVCADEVTARRRADDWHVMYCALDARSAEGPAGLHVSPDHSRRERRTEPREADNKAERDQAADHE